MSQDDYITFSKYSLIVPIEIAKRTDLPPGSKLLYAALAHFANKSNQCWPSQPTLANLIGVKQRQLRNLLDKLFEAGLVDWNRRHNDSNVYQLLGNKLPVTSTGNILPEDICSEHRSNILPEHNSNHTSTGNKVPTKSLLLGGNILPVRVNDPMNPF